MKKKIKDLSKKQIDTICKKYGERDEEYKVHCFECPLGDPNYCICLNSDSNSDKKWFLERYGNRKIEVEE